MAEVVENPQLRFTPDNQTPIAELWVEVPGLREEDPPSKLKVVGWGNLAQEIQDRYQQGDRLIIEGRLGMNTIDRPEGFKEKRAELTAQKIHLLDAGTSVTTAAAVPSSSTAAAPGKAAKPASGERSPSRSAPEPAQPPSYSAPSSDPVDYDEIPF